MDLGLEGKAALVTGSSRGIGLSIAQTLAREGARVFLCARGEEALSAATAALAGTGATVHAVSADVSTPSGAQKAVQAVIDRFGAIDVLVNNTGGSLGSGPFDRASEAKWTEVLNLNLLAAVYCSQHAVAFMRDHGGGAIANVTSICGREYCSSAPYVAAKAALTGLTKEMAVDLAMHGIRVNSVAPGSILFPGGSWDRRRTEQPELIAKMIRDDLPFGRFGAPEEVAEVVAFVCSARASWLTGASIPVDGGQGRAF
jgi:3-oxoacyl-[acyl-carrier protein] reductase